LLLAWAGLFTLTKIRRWPQRKNWGKAQKTLANNRQPPVEQARTCQSSSD
jgi:hypothetical protein